MLGLTTKEIFVTPSAVSRLKAVIGDNAGLRLRLVGGKGCGGNEYDLSPVSAAEVSAADEVLVVDEELKIFIPKADVLKLFGTVIDYIEDEVGNRHLEITNPNEKGRCGCGKSVNF